MTDSLRTAPSSPIVADDRADPPFLDHDRASLESWLELYRRTLPIKVGGLTAEQLCRRAVPPSTLSLIGLVRHLTEVEHYWFGSVVAGRPEDWLYSDPDPDGDIDDISTPTAPADLERYHAELPESRRLAAAVSDLDQRLPGRRHGQELNLRWVYVHDRGVRPPSRPRRPAPRVHRRQHRLLMCHSVVGRVRRAGDPRPVSPFPPLAVAEHRELTGLLRLLLDHHGHLDHAHSDHAQSDQDGA